MPPPPPCQLSPDGGSSREEHAVRRPAGSKWSFFGEPLVVRTRRDVPTDGSISEAA
jgi:hypothetical protein